MILQLKVIEILSPPLFTGTECDKKDGNITTSPKPGVYDLCSLINSLGNVECTKAGVGD
jgi:hypothetical protein